MPKFHVHSVGLSCYWPLNSGMAHQRAQQSFQMPGLDKTKQNRQPTQEVNGEKNTMQNSSNVSLFCMQINTMENFLQLHRQQLFSQ